MKNDQLKIIEENYNFTIDNVNLNEWLIRLFVDCDFSFYFNE